jgi:hypothetical protein
VTATEAAAAQPAKPRLWERPIAGLLVVLVAAALYAPTIALRRVDYDDYWLWNDASPLRELSASTLRDVFFELDGTARRPLGHEYLPVRDVSVAIDMAIWGDNEHGPHATQLALFVLCVFALGRLLVRWGVPPAVAWLGTLIWAAHPIHVESVAWLSERKGVLALLMSLVLGHAWHRFRDRDRGAWRWLAIAAIAAIAATWSKAPAMFGVGVFAAWDLLLLRASPRRWIAIAVVGAATAAAAVPVIAIANQARVIGVDDDGGVRDARVVMATGVAGHYVESLALAKRPSISYAIQMTGSSPADLAAGAASLAGSLAVVVWWWRRRRGDPRVRVAVAMLAWAWVWFVPISQLVVPVHVVVADRFALAWSLSGCVGVAAAILLLRAPLRTVVVAAVVAGLGVATIRAENAWTRTSALFENALDEFPGDALRRDSLAGVYYDAGDPDAAFAELARGLAIDPDEPRLLETRARYEEARHDMVDALVDAERAAASDKATALDLYARLLVRTRRPDAAIPFAERAVARHPEIGTYQRTYGVALLTVGRARDAVAPILAALVLDPEPDDRGLVDGLARALAAGT